jgi:hypothetical protein
MKEKTHLTFLDLLKDARDSHLAAKAELMLLLMLIVRCTPEERYSCFPGYPQLVEDTGLNIKTLKAAAAGLEKKRLVERKVRPNHSNRWFINAKLLHETAVANRAAKKEREEGYSDCPFELPAVNAVAAPANDEDNNGCEIPLKIQAVVTRIRELFSDHPTLQKARADRLIAENVMEMTLETKQTAEAVLNFLGDLSDKTMKTIAGSRHLGSYLKECFRKWATKHADTRLVTSVEGLLELLDDCSPDCCTVLGDTHLRTALEVLAERNGGVQRVADALCYAYTEQAFTGLESSEEVAELLRNEFDEWRRCYEEHNDEEEEAA